MEVFHEAADLYGLLHARYILGARGMALMREKSLNGTFGHCPRILCAGQPVIPVGLSDVLKQSRVKVFCPRCKEVYLPKKKCQDIDGAYFGTSFPHLLCKAFPDITSEEKKAYVPRIFGFRVVGCSGSVWEEDRQVKAHPAS